ARARRALLNRLRRLARGLHRAGAAILFADIFDHDQLRRDVLIALAGFFAELPQVLPADRAMLLGLLQIVNDAFPFQMAGQSAAPARVRLSITARGDRRIVVVGIVSRAFVLRDVFDVHALSFELGGEQRQLFIGDLFAAASAAG